MIASNGIDKSSTWTKIGEEGRTTRKENSGEFLNERSSDTSKIYMHEAIYKDTKIRENTLYHDDNDFNTSKECFAILGSICRVS